MSLILHKQHRKNNEEVKVIHTDGVVCSHTPPVTFKKEKNYEFITIKRSL